jgi:hypothetical protein
MINKDCSTILYWNYHFINKYYYLYSTYFSFKHKHFYEKYINTLNIILNHNIHMKINIDMLMNINSLTLI